MDLKNIAELAIKSGRVSEPKVAKVEAQVRTGMVYPLPDWIDTPVERPGTQSKERPE